MFKIHMQQLIGLLTAASKDFFPNLAQKKAFCELLI